MDFWTYLIIAVLVILSGLFSGLTLGLMSLNLHVLRRKVKLGNKRAKKIYPLRKQGNLLLCTLLLGNVFVNALLSVFLGSVMSGVLAVVISTALIVILGEIVPQAIISRYAMAFGSKSTWLVYGFLYVLYPITKPIAWTLDKTLGHELPTIFTKKELRLLLQEQSELKDSDLDRQEALMLRRGLIFSDKTVRDVMTPRVNVYFLQQHEILTMKKRTEIHETGHSRIPVYRKTPDEIVGVLYAKDLINGAVKKDRRVKTLMRDTVEYVLEDDQLDKVLTQFRRKQIHLFIVKDEFGGMSGIITLEDVLEEIIGEIVDEHDSYVDMRNPK